MIVRRHLLHAVFVFLALGACIYGWHQWRLTHPDRSYAMSELTQNMQTHCVGRLLIDLPAGTTWTPHASGAQLGDVTLSVTTGVSQREFLEQVERRWKEVEARQSNSEDIKRPAERSSPLDNSAVFTYGFRHADGPDFYGVWRNDINYDAEGYFWRDGTLFKIKPQLNGTEEIAKLLPRLHARATDEIPKNPGICLSGAFVEGYYDLADGEQEDVNWGFVLPRKLGVVVRHALVWTPGLPMLEKRRESDIEVAGLIARLLSEPGVVAGRKEYRAAKRVVGDLAGEEYVMAGTEGEGPHEFKTNAGGEWDFVGRGTPTPLPSINLAMDTTYLTSQKPSSLGDFPNAENVSGGPTEAEFFEIWDAIINSVRFRPGALTPPPTGKKPPSSPTNPNPVTSIHNPKPGTDDYSMEEFLAGLSSSENWMDKL
jgi:hypothetical protein